MAALFVWLRKTVQSRAAGAATVEVEMAHRQRRREGLPTLDGPTRKEVAMLNLQNRLPVLAQPLTKQGMAKLVESKVRRAHAVVDGIDEDPLG